MSENETPVAAPVASAVPADQLDGSFVPISRNQPGTSPRMVGGSAGATAHTDASKNEGIEQDFYLAISKKELGSRWFLSTYLAQSDFGDFAWPFGTAVVSFKVQNGKLFMFRTQAGTEVSDLIKPEFVMEAYPVVTGVKAFDAKANASDYILFDPAAGLNRFTVLGDKNFGVDIKLVFSQKFRKIKDGYTFEQVWSGNPQDPMYAQEQLSGTLSLALRRYAEGEGFVPKVLPEGMNFYFGSDPVLIKDEGKTMRYARRWNITPKSDPIVWAISPIAEKIMKEPRFAGYDIIGAIKTGIESWNQVFGFRALEARLAKEGEDYGADDVNYFAFDSDKSANAAFGVARHNPNTGEVRGASIYFPLAMFIDDVPAKTSVAVPPSEGMPGTTVTLSPSALGPDGKEKVRRSFKWGESQAEDFCDLAIRSFDQLIETTGATAPDKKMSNKEYVERYIAHVAMHEVGHTLGLRHNFKGSLRPPSSSVMDYLPTDEAAAFGSTPGSYDVAAIRQLYGLSDTPPADPFCTDQDESVDPDCRVFDLGATPLATYFAPFYGRVSERFLNGSLPPEYVVFVDEIVPHVRKAKDPALRQAAYEAAVAPLRQPVGPKVKANIRDFLTVQVYSRLFIKPLPVRTGAPKEESVARPPTDPVLTAAVADVKTFLIDAEGTRGMDVRRASADLLKAFQHATAAAALKEARDKLAAKVPMLMGNAAFETMDLVGRIDRYLGSYFN